MFFKEREEGLQETTNNTQTADLKEAKITIRPLGLLPWVETCACFERSVSVVI